MLSKLNSWSIWIYRQSHWDSPHIWNKLGLLIPSLPAYLEVAYLNTHTHSPSLSYQDHRYFEMRQTMVALLQMPDINRLFLLISAWKHWQQTNVRKGGLCSKSLKKKWRKKPNPALITRVWRWIVVISQVSGWRLMSFWEKETGLKKKKKNKQTEKGCTFWWNRVPTTEDQSCLLCREWRIIHFLFFHACSTHGDLIGQDAKYRQAAQQQGRAQSGRWGLSAAANH